MVNPIPEDIKKTLGELSSAQQVVIRGYIATLRAEIHQMEETARTANDPDPHAHYHGHEKCTADHGHDEHHHGEENKGHDHHDHGHHKEHKHSDHDHAHKEHHHSHDSHSHDDNHGAKGGHDHGHEHHGDDHHHGHEHGDASACTHESHAHKHGHEKSAEDIPAWKKKALDADPNAAPFGGSWNTESNITATKAAEKMDEN